MSKKTRTPEEKAAKKAAQEARDKKRLAAVEAKTKARKEAEEKGLPWNDTIVAARFLEDYEAAFMSAIAGTPKADEVKPEDNVVCGVNQDPEADQTTAQKSTAELVKAAKAALLPKTAAEKADEAVARFEERNPPTVTGETANDNSEEIEPLATEESQDNSYDPNNPATWLTDTNGGLVRLPSESNKKYGNRKHTFKKWKKAQAELATETVGRNDELPETKRYPTGDFGPDGYNSDEDGQSLPPPEKSAKEAAAVFEGATNEPATEAPATEQAEQVPSEEVAQPEPAQETTADEPIVQTEATVTADKPVDAKPTLTLASSQTEDEALAARAQKFYGDTWTAERAEKLTKAFKFLEMAIRLQQKGESDSRINMPMTSAIRLETEALGIAVAMTKAA